MSAAIAHAQSPPISTTVTGTTGLNTVPTARMDAPGTLRTGLSHLDPYNHAFIGFQIAKPLYVNLRQTMKVSSIGDQPEMVYPGLDVKLRLMEEGRYRPALAAGFDGLLGSSRFSSEYVALSKRFYDFDLTGGVAWGRLGSAGHLKNPFARLSSHFEKDRDYDSFDASSPSDLFTGEEIGFFGGVEYHTPARGLSLKADFNGDAYKGETLSSNFTKPSPWSFGFNYSPKDWVSFGASMIGLDKVMARLTFQTNIFDSDRKSYKRSEGFQLSGRRAGETWRGLAKEMGEAEGLTMGKTRVDKHDFSAVLYLNDYQPSAMQIGRAARHLAANAGPDIETLTVIPVARGLRGKAVTFSRRDLEQAIARRQGSAEEIWQDASFSDDDRSINARKQSHRLRLAPELAFSIGEEETTHLYRTSLVVEERKDWKYGFTTGSALRLNIADNLHRLFKFRDVNLNSVRSDAVLFTMNRVNLDRAFASFMKTPLPDLHFAATAGYLEEMYAGYGAEVLYRPFASPFAIGAEGWSVYKRDALTPLALGIFADPRFTGHANLYYKFPDSDLTAFAKIGRFIGGDFGVNTGAQMQLANGMTLKGSVSVTNSDDEDVFGGSRNLYAGLQLSIPFGDLRFVPQGSEARIKLAPIGRDDAALLDKPVDLYEITEPASYRHLGRSWQEVLN